MPNYAETIPTTGQISGCLKHSDLVDPISSASVSNFSWSQPQMRHQPLLHELLQRMQLHSKLQDILVWEDHSRVSTCFIVQVEHDVSLCVAGTGQNNVFR